MGIRGEDQRRVVRPIEDINEFNNFPLTAVTAIDTIFDVSPEQPPYQTNKKSIEARYKMAFCLLKMKTSPIEFVSNPCRKTSNF